MDTPQNTIRTRWAALGAAVAITLGASGIGVVGATIGSGERTGFVPITPCRLMDTRTPDNVGPRDTPIGEQEEHTVAAHGTNGQCTITDQATGLVLNVTAVDATAPTNLRLYPADQPVPATSNLNPFPGTPPVPNSVTTDIDANGQFKIFNAFGQVDVIADVVGFYEDHNHDDRYPLTDDVYTKAQVDSKTADPSSQVILGGDFQPASVAVGHSRPDGAFRFVNTAGACAFAPIRLTAGRSIGRIDVRYLTTTLNASMNVRLVGRSLTSGSMTGDASDVHVIAQGTSGPLKLDSVQTHSVKVSPRATLRQDFAYSLRICTDQTVTIRQAQVGRGSLVDIDPFPIDPVLTDPLPIDPQI